MSRPVRTFSRSISLMGIFLCSEKVRCRNNIGARNVKVSISSLAAAYTCHKYLLWHKGHLSSFGESSTLCFGLTRGIDVWNSHQFEKSFTLFVVFFGNSDCSSTEFIDFFCCSDFLCFLFCFFCFFSLCISFC